MSAFRRMIGRELPCTIFDLVDLTPAEVTEHEAPQRTFGPAQADPEALCRLGLSHLERGKWGLARSALREAVSLRPGLAQARLALAGACERLAEHDRAAAHIDAVLANTEAGEPQRYRLLCAAGLCLERAGLWREAKGRYVRALSVRGGDCFAIYRLAAIHLAHEELSEAAACLRDILRHQPQELAGRACLGHLLQMNGRHADAVWEYEQALCLQPDSWELPARFAEELHGMADSEEAVGLVERLIAMQPHCPDLRMRLGNLYSRQGEDQSAQAEFERALALHPEFLDCHISLARHELRMGRAAAAGEHFRRAFVINQQNVEVYAGLALALRRSGRTRQAEEMLASAGRIGNNSAVLLAQAARVEAESTDEAAACRELHPEWIEEIVVRYEQYLLEQPGDDDARLRSALLLRLLGRSDDALQAVRRIVLEEPGRIDAWLQAALVLADQGKVEQAAVALEQGVGVDCRSLRLAYQLALIYCGEHEFDLAMERIEAQDENASHRLWTVIEGMQLDGLRRGRSGHDRNISGVKDATEM